MGAQVRPSVFLFPLTPRFLGCASCVLSRGAFFGTFWGSKTSGALCPMPSSTPVCGPKNIPMHCVHYCRFPDPVHVFLVLWRCVDSCTAVPHFCLPGCCIALPGACVSQWSAVAPHLPHAVLPGRPCAFAGRAAVFPCSGTRGTQRLSRMRGSQDYCK